jgi:hypothetical protein
MKLVSWPPSPADSDFPDFILVEQAILTNQCIAA